MVISQGGAHTYRRCLMSQSHMSQCPHCGHWDEGKTVRWRRKTVRWRRKTVRWHIFYLYKLVNRSQR